MQVLVSLDSLQGLGGWFNETVSSLDDSSRAVVGGWAASLTLTALQMLTLYSGLLGILAQAMGHASHTQAGNGMHHVMHHGMHDVMHYVGIATLRIM